VLKLELYIVKLNIHVVHDNDCIYDFLRQSTDIKGASQLCI